MISGKINENTLSIRYCRSESRLNIWVCVCVWEEGGTQSWKYQELQLWDEFYFTFERQNNPHSVEGGV